MSITRITVAGGSLVEMGWRRGDYLETSGTGAYGDRQRIMRVDAPSHTLTTRTAMTYRALEWCAAKLEDWVLWPYDDARAKVGEFRSRFRVRT